MNCSHAQFLVHLAQCELSPDDRALLETHLQSCPTCAAISAEEVAFDSAMRRAMSAVTIPEGLAARLHSQTAATARTLARRWWLTRVGGAVLAASVMFGAYLGLVRESLNTANLAELHDQFFRQPGESASDWLTRQKLWGALPEDFDLQLATFWGRVNVQGVPMLALRLEAANRQTAWVYFVNPLQFRTGAAEEGQMTSHTAVKVYRGRPGGWTVVVVYTGNDWKAFLKPPIAPG